MTKFAQHYFNKRGFTSDEILPMSGAGPVLSDYLLGQLGANRSGRAHAMATASGTPEEEIPFKVRHPITSNTLNSLGGGIAGGLAGAALGAGFGGLNGGPPGSVGTGAAIGGAGGVALGMIAALIANSASRRRDMRDISKKFDNTPQLRPKPIEPDSVLDYLLPYGGFANKGERDTHHYLAGRNKESPHFDGVHVAENILPFAAAALVPHGAMGVDVASGIAENLRSRHPKTAKFTQHYLKTAGLGNLIRKAYAGGGYIDVGTNTQKFLARHAPQVAAGAASGAGTYSIIDENNPNRLAYSLAAGAGVGSIASPMSLRRYKRLALTDNNDIGKAFMQKAEGMPRNYIPGSNRELLKDMGLDVLLKTAPTAIIAGGAGAVAASEALNNAQRATEAGARASEDFAGGGTYRAYNTTTDKIWNMSGDNAKRVHEFLGKNTSGLKFNKTFGQTPLTNEELKQFTDITPGPSGGAQLKESVEELGSTIKGIKEMVAKGPEGQSKDPLGFQPGLAPIAKSIDTAAQSSQDLTRQLGTTGKWIDSKVTEAGDWLNKNKKPLGYGAAGVAALGGGLVLAKLIEAVGNLRKEYIPTKEEKKKEKSVA